MKKKILNGLIIVIIVAIVVMFIWWKKNGSNVFNASFDDGVEIEDVNNIYFVDSKVHVKFSDVILNEQKEQRKLIVSEQTGTIEVELSKKTIKFLDIKALTKSQKVTYEAEAAFTVDLSKLTSDCIIQDDNTKTLTIKIPHAKLETLEIDPNKIIIGDVKESLMAWGDIKMTVKQYTEIEKSIQNRFIEKFNTAANGQKADQIALEQVKAIYEPIIKAIDSEYEVVVEFVN